MLEVVLALHTAGGFAGRLDGGLKQRDEHPNDGDDDEEFHERETRAAAL